MVAISLASSVDEPSHVIGGILKLYILSCARSVLTSVVWSEGQSVPQGQPAFKIGGTPRAPKANFKGGRWLMDVQSSKDLMVSVVVDVNKILDFSSFLLQCNEVGVITLFHNVSYSLV